MATLLAPLLLSGCMMAGMAGMAGMGGMGHAVGAGSHDDGLMAAPGVPTIIKEVVVGELRVTADFPAYAWGDSLRYAVTLRGIDGRAFTAGASVFLDVSPTTIDSAAGAPEATHAGHSMVTAPATPGASQRTRYTPAEREGGRFVFRPSIPREGTYRLAVLVERAGDTVMDPPLVVEHVVRLSPPSAMPATAGHAMRGGRLTPLVVLGAGVMALMMLVAVR